MTPALAGFAWLSAWLLAMGITARRWRSAILEPECDGHRKRLRFLLGYLLVGPYGASSVVVMIVSMVETFLLADVDSLLFLAPVASVAWLVIVGLKKLWTRDHARLDRLVINAALFLVAMGLPGHYYTISWWASL